jgi:protein gp37
MADVFEMNHALDSERLRLFGLIEATPHLTWQLLTKRPENILRLVPVEWRDGWMPENIWLGTTVEDAARGALRVPRLVTAAAHLKVTRFLSVEPLIEAVRLELEGIDWVIVGCESGPGARPFHLDWAWSIVEQCADQGVACFVKQLPGERRGSVIKDLSQFPPGLQVRQFPQGGTNMTRDIALLDGTVVKGRRDG